MLESSTITSTSGRVVAASGAAAPLSVTLGSSESAAAVKPKSMEPQAGWFGLTVEELPRNMRISGLTGVLVTAVDPGGMAAEAGIQQGDIIISVNQKKVANLAQYAGAMKEAERKGSVALLVKRGDANIYFALKIK